MSDHDSAGTLSTFTAITPVLPGREAALRERLRHLPAGPGSPLARVPGTHIARLFVVAALPYVVLERSHLLFGAAFDGPRRPYLLALHETLGGDAERIWGDCDGFAADGGAEAFADWLERHRVPARAVLAACPQVTLAQVREALDLRHRIGLFAARHQRRAAHEVRQAFEREFGET